MSCVCVCLTIFVVCKLLTSSIQLKQWQHVCSQQRKESSCTVVVPFLAIGVESMVSRLKCTVGYWWSGLKFEKNCVPPQDVNSHNLGFVYLEASVKVYSTEEYVDF